MEQEVSALMELISLICSPLQRNSELVDLLGSYLIWFEADNKLSNVSRFKLSQS